MSQQRKLAFSFTPTSVDEANGVSIRRSIGAERLAILDPLILLDHASIPAGSDVVGFPRHPHRGIETLSYVLAGTVGHKDSKGNEGTVGPGGTQWMTAGNGIFHEEMMSPAEDGAEMLQLWFSLPADKKRIPAAYMGGPADEVPVVKVDGAKVRVVAGSFAGTSGSFTGIAVDPTVLDIHLEPDATVEIATRPGDAAIAYILEGSISLDDHIGRSVMLAVFTDGDSVTLMARDKGARVFFVSARPTQEPILQYRSFVMNTPEDIAETLEMIKAGDFGN
jgi:redox-sensitive bicupin YhaK (pirin superfamily)